MPTAEAPPPRPTRTILLGSVLLLAGIILAQVITYALSRGLEAVARRSGAPLLPILALPVLAILVSGWVLGVVYQLGLRSRNPGVGIASFLLLVVPAVVAWVPALKIQPFAQALTLTLAASLVPAYLGARAARGKLAAAQE